MGLAILCAAGIVGTGGRSSVDSILIALSADVGLPACLLRPFEIVVDDSIMGLGPRLCMLLTGTAVCVGALTGTFGAGSDGSVGLDKGESVLMIDWAESFFPESDCTGRNPDVVPESLLKSERTGLASLDANVDAGAILLVDEVNDTLLRVLVKLARSPLLVSFSVSLPLEEPPKIEPKLRLRGLLSLFGSLKFAAAAGGLDLSFVLAFGLASPD